VALRNAILTALAENASADEIEAAIERVSAAGIPGAQQMLF
jgi:transcriptional/translational regulatory protein YebC/TACO1